MNWQPIETAPRDGNDILVLRDGRCFVAGWVKNSIIHKRDVWMISGGFAIEPSFWMPIPENPPELNPKTILPEAH